MASICSAIDLEFLEPRRWRVARPIVYHHPVTVTVPAGMVTDLASTPVCSGRFCHLPEVTLRRQSFTTTST